MQRRINILLPRLLPRRRQQLLSLGQPPAPATPSGCGIISCRVWRHKIRHQTPEFVRAATCPSPRPVIPFPMLYGLMPRRWIRSPGAQTNIITAYPINMDQSFTSSPHGLSTVLGRFVPIQKITGGAKIIICPVQDLPLLFPSQIQMGLLVSLSQIPRYTQALRRLHSIPQQEPDQTEQLSQELPRPAMP